MIPPIESTQLALVVKEPLGVVGCIVPWNYPLLLLAWKLAPALAAGNTTVCKPSELTPLSTLMLAPLLRPPARRRRQLCSPAPATSARAIVADERVDCVAFTGSVETGKKVAAACAERIARINLEMGGKDPFIVCADVGRTTIEVAARGGAWAAYLNAGPGLHLGRALLRASRTSTTTTSRAFVDHTKQPRRRRPDRRRHRRRPDGLGAAARRRSPPRSRPRSAPAPSSLTGGGNAGHERGPLLRARGRHRRPGARPTLLREETFGPVAPIVPVKSLDEAIELANGTRFGLGANVYTRDLATMRPLHARDPAGTVWFNDPLTDNDAGPFGGFKQSGLGRELGREGLEAFQETKHVHIETEIAPKEWWYPYGGGGGSGGGHGA